MESPLQKHLSLQNLLAAQNAAAAEGKEALAKVSPQTIEFLEKHVAQLKFKLESLRAEIADLEDKLVHQFDDMHHVGYKLHSVFIHRGQATFGHYWVHIHDFRSNIYRMYNDKTVAEVPADEVLGIPSWVHNAQGCRCHGILCDLCSRRLVGSC